MTYLNRISSIRTLDNAVCESAYDYNTFLSDMGDIIHETHNSLNDIAIGINESAIESIVKNMSCAHIMIESNSEAVKEVIDKSSDNVIEKYKKTIRLLYDTAYQKLEAIKAHYIGNKKAILTTTLNDKYKDLHEEACLLIPDFFDYKKIIKNFNNQDYKMPKFVKFTAGDIESNKKKLDDILKYVSTDLNSKKDSLLKKKKPNSMSIEKFTADYINEVDNFRVYIANIVKYIRCITKVIYLYALENINESVDNTGLAKEPTLVDPTISRATDDYIEDEIINKIETDHIVSISPIKKEADALNIVLESCYNDMVRNAISIKSRFVEIMSESTDDVDTAIKKSIPASIWDTIIRLLTNAINAIKTFWRNSVMNTRNHFGTYEKWYIKNKTKVTEALGIYGKDGSSVKISGYVFISDDAINSCKTDKIKQAVGKIINKVNTNDVTKMTSQVEKVNNYSDEDIYKAITKDILGESFSNRNMMVESFKSKYKVDEEKELVISTHDINMATTVITNVTSKVDQLNVHLKKHSFDDELTQMINISEKFKRNKDTSNIVAQYYKAMYRVYSVAQKILNDVYKYKLDLCEKQAYYSFKVLKAIIK